MGKGHPDVLDMLVVRANSKSANPRLDQNRLLELLDQYVEEKTANKSEYNALQGSLSESVGSLA
jgi:hypothetical protein